MDLFAEVLINTPARALDKIFDYSIPQALQQSVAPGCLVEVPFGGGNAAKEAYVVGVKQHSDAVRLKDVKRVLHPSVLTEKDFALARFIKDQTLCTLLEAVKLLLPPGLQIKLDETVTLTGSPEGLRGKKQELASLLAQHGSMTMTELKALAGPCQRYVREMAEQGVVSVTQTASQAVREKTVTAVTYVAEDDPAQLCEQLAKRAPAQAKVIDVLANYAYLSVTELALAAGCTRGVIDALEKKGYVAYEKIEVRRSPFAGRRIQPTTKLSPTPEQAVAIGQIKQAILGEAADTFLLHGVTGSGKTEVFLQAIETVLEKGKTAIVLVPEISLTPQMTDRFLARFGDGVAILHSALSMGERLDEWNRIRQGKARVVVGARSAVFAPVDNLGLLIVDEEHENTYKSETTPRYDAICVARFRGEQHGAPVVLASATPSVESYFRAQNGEYRLLSMENRYNNVALPDVTIVDMREELKNGNRSVFSEYLARELEYNIQKKEQTVLFLNRRGFSTFVSCRDCGFVARCPKCSVSLTYHKSTNTLNCHYCGHQTANYTVCPECGGRHIRYFGTGTQRVEQELGQMFPQSTSVRMDVDTTGTKNAHEKLLEHFHKDGVDVLLGTQMVSKGLDYPNISLVGVLAADMSLNMDDFRAGERTFNLITQVCGRAGRGKVRGRAVIQTYEPENPVLQFAKEQDYLGFYEHEIQFRKAFSYPPFCDIVLFTASGLSEARVALLLKKVEACVRQLLGQREDITFFAAGKAPIDRIKSKYRYRFWLKCKADEALLDALRQGISYFYSLKQEDVKLAVAINPPSML